MPVKNGSATARAKTPLHRNREFMVLWTSQVVSTIGTRVTSVGYPLLVLAITRSPEQAGIVAFAQTLPFLLLQLPAGALVDRWDRKRTMIACEAGRALALGSVALTTALGTVSVPQLALVAFVEGSLFVFFDLSEGAALPRLVPADQLPTANRPEPGPYAGRRSRRTAPRRVAVLDFEGCALPRRCDELPRLFGGAPVHTNTTARCPHVSPWPAARRDR